MGQLLMIVKVTNIDWPIEWTQLGNAPSFINVKHLTSVTESNVITIFRVV